MSERRMFAKAIVDSDSFLDMPLSAQALYFHLCMRADDEGFINNHRKIQRMIGATSEDMDMLLSKNFVIEFESGVVVIKHWKIHNYIRSDRLVETNYKEERDMLEVKENKAYTLASNVRQMTDKRQTDDSIDKDSKEKVSRDKDIDYQGVIDLFHEICVSYPKVRSLSDARKKAIKARLKQYTMDELREVFENAENSDFLKGNNNKNWSANFDWLMSDRNIAKVLDGNYGKTLATAKAVGNTYIEAIGNRVDMVDGW